MALFQRRPQTSDPTNFYTVGQIKNILIVGLGNPGEQYNLTRHNAGYSVVDEFVSKSDEMDSWMNKRDFKCLMSSGRIGEKRIIAIKPTTFMNHSGESVRAISDFYKIHPDQIVVVHDELDIEFGQIRLRKGGADAGHNGIKSVTNHIGPDYWRIRIGIGPKRPAGVASEDYVLQQFDTTEQSQLANLNKEVTAILSEYIYGGELPHETRNFIV